jgi:hypothetical protein
MPTRCFDMHASGDPGRLVEGAHASLLLREQGHFRQGRPGRDRRADGFSIEDAAAILADPKEQAEIEKQIVASRAKGVRSVPTYNIGGLAMGGSEDQMAKAIARVIR